MYERLRRTLADFQTLFSGCSSHRQLPVENCFVKLFLPLENRVLPFLPHVCGKNMVPIIVYMVITPDDPDKTIVDVCHPGIVAFFFFTRALLDVHDVPKLVEDWIY